MLPWINIISIFVFSILFTWLYIISVSPAQMEKKIGSKAYQRCGMIRAIAMVFMFVVMANYIIFYFYPPDNFPLPLSFSWPYWVSIVIAVILGIPSSYLMVRGMIDAGKEMAVPQRDGEMYGGIYKKIRHPQAWEAVLWFVIAFVLHSPFLVLISFLYLPIEYWMVRAEEKDLVIRFGEAYRDYINDVGMFWPKRK